MKKTSRKDHVKNVESMKKLVAGKIKKTAMGNYSPMGKKIDKENSAITKWSNRENVQK